MEADPETRPLVEDDPLSVAMEDKDKENYESIQQPYNSPLPDYPQQLDATDNKSSPTKPGFTEFSQMPNLMFEKAISQPGLHPSDRLYQLSQQWVNSLDPLRLNTNPNPERIEGLLGVKLISTQPFVKVKDPPPGYGRPVPFYIYQRQPFTPAPLQAWRGYHGNVYFDPVHVTPSTLQKPSFEVKLPPINFRSHQFQKVIANSRWDPEHVMEYRQKCEDQREQVLYTSQAKQPKRQQPPSNIQLDPALLLENSLEARLLRMSLHTGTLNVMNPNSPNSPTRSPLRTPRGRLHKGFVFRGNKSASVESHNAATARSPIKFRPPQTPNYQ